MRRASLLLLVVAAPWLALAQQQAPPAPEAPPQPGPVPGAPEQPPTTQPADDDVPELPSVQKGQAFKLPVVERVQFRGNRKVEDDAMRVNLLSRAGAELDPE